MGSGRKRKFLSARVFYVNQYIFVYSMCAAAPFSGHLSFLPMCFTILLMVGWKSSFMASCVSRSIPWEDHFTIFILHTQKEVKNHSVIESCTYARCSLIAPLSPHSLAPSQGSLHTLPSVPLVVVDERERQGDVEGVGPARRRCAFPRLKRDHEVHPGRWPLGFKALDEVLAKDLAQHGFEGQVDSDGAVGTAWRKHRSYRNCRKCVCFFCPL